MPPPLATPPRASPTSAAPRVASVRGAATSLAMVASLLAHVGIGGLLVAAGRRGVAPPAGDPLPTLAGDTFELPAADDMFVPLANASPAPEAPDPAATPKPEAPDSVAEEAIRPSATRRTRPPATRPSAPARPSAGRASTARAEPGEAGVSSSTLYGAVGERSAVDLATAFRRSFAQAASGNPAWAAAPLGAAGDAVVVLDLDPEGHVTSHRVEGAPTPALSAGIRSTLALLGARPFVAKGAVTRLRVVGTISPSEARDDMHGVYGIGFSEDRAFFALPAGRRIEVRIRPL